MLQRKLTDLEVVEDQITNQVAGLITQMVRPSLFIEFLLLSRYLKLCLFGPSRVGSLHRIVVSKLVLLDLSLFGRPLLLLLNLPLQDLNLLLSE